MIYVLFEIYRIYKVEISETIESFPRRRLSSTCSLKCKYPSGIVSLSPDYIVAVTCGVAAGAGGGGSTLRVHYTGMY